MGVVKDLILRILVLVAVVWSIRVFLEVYGEISKRQAQQPDKYPQSADLLKAVGVFLALWVGQVAFRKVFDAVARALIPKKPRWSYEVWGAKVTRCCDAIFRFGYYVGMTVWGYQLLKGASWTPNVLGGSGDVRFCWKEGFPFQVLDPNLQLFYLAHVGFHLCEVAMLLSEKKHPDFWEMFLHGSLSVTLLTLSYMLNYVRIGSLVLLLHGATDISIYASKAFVDTGYTKLVGLSFFSLLASYAWLRIFVFPVYVMKSAWQESIEEVKPTELFGWGFLNFALLSLLLLHMYWFGLIVKIALHFNSTGQAKDLQSNLSALELANQKKKA